VLLRATQGASSRRLETEGCPEIFLALPGSERAERRDERRGRFPSSRPIASLWRLGVAVELAETDTKSRGTFKKAPSSRRPLGSRLEYPIDGGRNRRHSPSATTIEA
jgi:hypothetical protein